jgi:hypothetical protein
MGNRSIYSYHYYTNVNLGDPRRYFEARRRDYTRWGAAGFLTETEMDPAVFDVADEFLQSWTIWEVCAR